MSKMSVAVLPETIALENDKKGVAELGEPDYNQVLKVEFAKLHKEYRVLENKRHEYAQQEGTMRTRSKRILPLLEKDQKELKYELRNAKSRFHRKIADGLAHSMKAALKTYDLYQEALGKKIKQIQEIERHVDKITDKVVKQKFKMLALHGSSKSIDQRERDLTKAEDKLYNLTCQFNVQINENQKVKDNIMNFLMERARFFKTHNSLKRQLSHAKTKMLKIVQLAIHTYDARDDAMLKVKTLREREVKEAKQHGMEVQEFERTLHHDKKILNFIKTKCRTRSLIEGAKDRKMRLGMAKEKELDMILQRYRKCFRRILAYSETNSISDLVYAYKDLEGDNVIEFKYITNLNSECEVLRDAIQILTSKIEVAHAEVESREREQKETHQALQRSIIAKQELFGVLEKQRALNKSRLKEITNAVGVAFTQAKCQRSAIMRLLGNRRGMTPNNIRLCIEQLDLRITEMKVERDRLQAAKSNNKNVSAFQPSVLAKSKVESQGGPYYPNVMIGGMYNADAMEDEDLKIMEQEPYYYDEMREYVYHKMVEDRLIDPLQRSVSTLLLPSGEPSRHAEEADSRNRLLQKFQSQQSQKQKRKHNNNQTGENEDTDAYQYSEDGDQRQLHRNSKSIVNLGKQLQNILSRDSTHPSPEDINVGDPLLLGFGIGKQRGQKRKSGIVRQSFHQSGGGHEQIRRSTAMSSDQGDEEEDEEEEVNEMGEEGDDGVVPAELAAPIEETHDQGKESPKQKANRYGLEEFEEQFSSSRRKSPRNTRASALRRPTTPSNLLPLGLNAPRSSMSYNKLP